MSEAKLDQLVKGAPAPDHTHPIVFSSDVITSPPSSTAPSHLSDPLASLPSSPPQIYLNMLILEASLRAQYLELRARRRQYTFFLTILGLWNLYFGYALFLAPREDGSGVGGSVYWVIEVTEKVAFMGGIVTGILVWGTGQWERGIRWPRRWVGITNRGLRGFNCKIVIVKGPWWKEWLSILWFLLSNGLFSSHDSSAYRYVDHNLQSETEKGSKPALPNIHEDDIPLATHEEDLSPGGDTIKLLLLPKPFSPAFRENWDLYRCEYWDRENERRRLLLSKLKLQDKKLARDQPRPSILSRLRLGASKTTHKDVEKSHHNHGHSHAHPNNQHRPSQLGVANPAEKRLRSASNRSGSHSRTSSRSSTPTRELDDGGAGPGVLTSQRVRRGSNASTSSNSSSLRKKKGSANSSSSTAPRVQKLTPSNSSLSQGTGRATPFVRGNSFSSTDGSRPSTPAGLTVTAAAAAADGEKEQRAGDGNHVRSLKGSGVGG